jgi:uroporphyrinogen III methyltransferase/synthase
MHTTVEGKVYLVGAGPGDPGLLTVKGKECLELADVVVADYLANQALLKHVRPDAECVTLGRRGTPQHLSQEAIISLLIQRARAGKQVVRLKNGDPFLFGRGGEEGQALATSQVAFEVVPGVSAAMACPAYLGIPVTHRRYASQVTIVTGHEDASQPESDIDWKTLARSQGTLVILMGLRTLPAILGTLLAHGMPASTPVAVISNGTLSTQKAVIGTIEEVETCLPSEPLEFPVMAVIGEVVRLAPLLHWFHADSPKAPSTLSL